MFLWDGFQEKAAAVGAFSPERQQTRHVRLQVSGMQFSISTKAAVNAAFQGKNVCVWVILSCKMLLPIYKKPFPPSPWCFYSAERSYRKHDSRGRERKCREKWQGMAPRRPLHPAKEEPQSHEAGRRFKKKGATGQQSTCEAHRLDLWRMSPVVPWKRLVCVSREDGPHKGQRSWIPHAGMCMFCQKWKSL